MCEDSVPNRDSSGRWSESKRRSVKSGRFGSRTSATTTRWASKYPEPPQLGGGLNSIPEPSSREELRVRSHTSACPATLGLFVCQSFFSGTLIRSRIGCFYDVSKYYLRYVTGDIRTKPLHFERKPKHRVRWPGCQRRNIKSVHVDDGDTKW
jgi:hypothetical protein